MGVATAVVMIMAMSGVRRGRGHARGALARVVLVKTAAFEDDPDAAEDLAELPSTVWASGQGRVGEGLYGFEVLAT